MADKSFTVPRQFAAEILNVSVRTLDRYTKGKKISSKRRGRQLYFSEQELLDYKAKQLAQEQLEQVHQRRYQQASRDTQRKQTERVSTRQHDFVEVEAAQAKEQAFFDGAQGGGEVDEVDAEFADIRDSLLRRSPEESIYRSLYKKAEKELAGLRQKLELANYQVGKLEAQVKSMVPLLEFNKQKQELLTLAEENRGKTENLFELEQQLRLERWVKRIYAGFLFFMMGLMPLLVILRLFA